MLHKIITFFIVFFLSFGMTFSYEQYVDSDTVQVYKQVIETKVGDTLDKKPLQFKIDFLVKIEKIMSVYEKKNISQSNKTRIISMLVAFRQVVTESIGQSEQAVEESIEILIIDDKRCSNCYTDSIVEEMQKLPFLTEATYTFQDFSDAGVSEYLVENNIQKLPAVIFNTKDIDDGGTMKPYLSSLGNTGYLLEIGATHDPFIERSARGYLVLESSVVTSLKNNSYIDGNKDAEILWIEYSDLECPFCAKLHNDGTIEKIQETYGNSVAFSYKHFPLSFHQDAEGLAQATECMASGNSEVYYGTIDAIYAQSYSLSDLYKSFGEVSTSLESEIKLCVENETYLEKVQSHLSEGIEVFGVTGTPGNALINTKTGEYTTIGGAYPYATFESEIQKLLK